MANPDLRSELAATEQAVQAAQRHLGELTEYRDSLLASCNGQQPAAETPDSEPVPAPEQPTQTDDFDVTL